MDTKARAVGGLHATKFLLHALSLRLLGFCWFCNLSEAAEQAEWKSSSPRPREPRERMENYEVLGTIGEGCVPTLCRP